MLRLALLALIAAAVPLSAAYLYASAAALPEPTGTVRDTAGAPLPGVTVTVVFPDGVVTKSVITDEWGRFTLPDLPSGTYALRARRIGFDDALLEGFDPSSGSPAELTLASRADIFAQVPSSYFLDLLPEGEAKWAFILDCTGCHQFDQRTVAPGGAWRSEAGWRSKIDQMLAFAGGSTSFPIISPSRDASATADWLVAHLGAPGDPLPAFDPPSPMTGADAEVTITEYDIPSGTDLPHDLMPDGQGRVVITGMQTHRMYVLDPATGAFETVAIPVPGANPRALTIAPDGTWWVLLGAPHKLASYQPATGVWETFDIGMYGHSIVRDDAGRVWFNGHFTKDPELIGWVQDGFVETIEVPVEPMPDGGSTIPYGLRVDAAGTVWMTELRGNRLVKFVPEPGPFPLDGTFTLYEMPTPVSGPRRPAIAPDGAIWIPEYAANKVARFDPQAETFEEWTLPIPDALPYIVRVDPASGMVWVATGGADAVLRFDPQTEAWAVHRLPTPKALVRHMELDSQTGAAWVAYGNAPAVDPKVARIEVSGLPTPTEPGAAPEEFGLLEVYPNPLRATVHVAFELPEPAFVRLEVLDVRGRRVASLVAEERSAGRYEAAFDASALPSGTYFCRLQARGRSVVRKLLRVR